MEMLVALSKFVDLAIRSNVYHVESWMNETFTHAPARDVTKRYTPSATSEKDETVNHGIIEG